MTQNTQILIVIWTFWMAVAAFDLLALVTLRRRQVPATATVLWVMWIIGVPVLGAAAFFLVVPREAVPQHRR